MEIHVRIDSQSYGPYDLQQVHDLMANGQLKGNNPAWCEGMADWSTLDLVLAQMDPDNAPAPSEFAAPPKVDCPKCGAAMNPTDVSCYKCGFQPGLRGKDSRHKRPEERGQNPKGWVKKGFTDTGKVLFLDKPHAPTEYWIYKSIKPYLKGQVEIPGIDEVVGDPVLMWTLFLEAGKLAVDAEEKLTTIWSKIKENH